MLANTRKNIRELATKQCTFAKEQCTYMKKPKTGRDVEKNEVVSLPTTPPVPSEADAKIAAIAPLFEEIMNILGLDTSDEHLRDSPMRVARTYVSELFAGLNPALAPDLTTFPNHFQFHSMLVEKNIRLHSVSAIQFLPFSGKVHVGYFPSHQIIGLSNIHKIADYCARRPQLQEQLTHQILEALQQALQTPDVIVALDTRHEGVQSRGVSDHTCGTFSMDYGGKFESAVHRQAFLAALD